MERAGRHWSHFRQDLKAVNDSAALCAFEDRCSRSVCYNRVMSTKSQEILNRALELPPADKAHIANELLASLDQPDEAIDALWRKEVEDRIAAYKAGALKSVSLEEVLAKYR